MRPKTLSNRLNQVLIAVLTIVALAMGQSAWADNINISADATDLALTDGGWIMIEGNDKGMFVGIQKTTQKGFRPYLDMILSEMNIKM